MMRSAFISSSLCVVFIIAFRSAAQDQSLINDLKKHVSDYTAVESSHFVADMRIRLREGNVVGDSHEGFRDLSKGTFKYFGSGGKYRNEVFMESSQKSDSALTIKAETSYDGRRYYNLTHDERKLIVGSNATPTAAIALQNPMLGGLEFMHLPNDKRPFSRLLFADVANIDKQEQVFSGAKWVFKTSTDGAYLLATTGNKINNQFQSFRVFMRPIDGVDHQVPVRVEQFVGDEKVTRTLISDYSIIQIGDRKIALPKVVRMQEYTGGEVDMEIFAQIESYQVNQEISPDRFVIDHHRAESVFDDDLGMFVQQKGGFQTLGAVVENLPPSRPSLNTESPAATLSDAQGGGGFEDNNHFVENEALEAHADTGRLSTVVVVVSVVFVVLAAFFSWRWCCMVRRRNQ